VMMVLATGVTIFLLTYVLPKFTPMFNRKGIVLPKPTIFMMAASNTLIHHWYLWLAGFVILVVVFVFGRRTPQGRDFLDWAKITVPLLGPMTRKVVISRSVRTLGMMVASGVPMLDALRLAADVAGNVFYDRLWRHVIEEVTSGKQVCDALAGNPLFPQMLVQMISSGEQTGKLGPVLEKVSSHFDQEVESSLKAMTSMIEPIMITIMGVVVGGIALALLLPIFQLSKSP